MSGKEGNKKYRDSVFRDYFNEPVRWLSLCNVILDTQYSDVGNLKINTLEDIFFDNQKNDISCTIGELKALISFPVHKFFVLYDGDNKEPLQKEMKLSEAFRGDGSSLELVVTAFNINYGLNQPLLKKCQ